MAIYVYQKSDGVLVSWMPEDLTIAEAQESGQLATDDVLVAKSFWRVDQLPPLGPTVAWDEATRTTITVEAPIPANPIHTFDFIMAFTPDELDAVRNSPDKGVQQFLYAMQVTQGVNLNHSAIGNFLTYLVDDGTLTQARADEILLTTNSGAVGVM